MEAHVGKHILVRSEELRERIEEYIDKSGLKPGDKLPSERAFAEALGTSRVTLRDALMRMQDEGLIETRHGKGSFVAPPKFEEDARSFLSCTSGWEADGFKVSSEVLSFLEKEAGAKAARMLNIPIGEPVFELKRVRRLDGVPVFIETSNIPSCRVPGLKKYDFSSCSLYTVLEKDYGIVLTQQTQTFSITHLSEKEARWLGVDQDTPAFYICGTTFDAAGTPTEFTVSINRADRYNVSAWLTRQTPAMDSEG